MAVPAPDARRARAGAVISPNRAARMPSPPTPVRTPTDARLRRPSSQLPRTLWLGRVLRGAGLLGVAGLAAVGVLEVARWVETTDALPVRTVAVLTSGGRGVEGARADEVLAYAGVSAGQPLFGVDVDDVAARVKEHPFVSSVTVRRVPPDGIEIVVEPRAPLAVLAAGDGLYLVDGRGAVMKTARPGDGLDLPLITGIEAAAVADGSAQDTLQGAVAVVVAHAKAGAPGGPLAEVHHDAAGYEVVLDDGARVRIGRGDIERKLTALAAILERLEGKKAASIFLDDERRPERAAVRLQPETETAPAGGNKDIPRERG